MLCTILHFIGLYWALHGYMLCSAVQCFDLLHHIAHAFEQDKCFAVLLGDDILLLIHFQTIYFPDTLLRCFCGKNPTALLHARLPLYGKNITATSLVG